MKTKHPLFRPNQIKDHVKINLSGNYSGKVNILFEVYRQAINLNLSGYVKKKDETHTEILVTGERGAVGKFLDWLKIMISKMNIRLVTEKPEVLIEYREFRIIH